jgi:tetratricopeptide (TPR) repeat protein
MAQYDEALRAAEQAQDDRLLGRARVRRGTILLELEREEGFQVLEDAIRLLEASGDLETLSVALYNVSTFYKDRGKFDLALTSYERGLAVAERLGDLEGIARHKEQLGDIRFALGRWVQARQYCEQVATLLPEVRPSLPLIWSHLSLGLLSLAQGQAGTAAEYLQHGQVLAERSDNPGLLSWASCAVAYQDLVEGRPQAACARLEPLLDRSSLLADERAWVQHLLGWASLELGDLERAEALLAEASTLATAHLPRLKVVGVLHSQTRLALRQGRWQEAEHALAEALALTLAMHTPYEEAQTLYLYGLLHLQQGETQSARERLVAALAICRQLGERLYARQIERALASLGHQEEPGSL